MDRECSLNVLEIYKIYTLKAIFAIKIHSDHCDKRKTYLGPDQKNVNKWNYLPWTKHRNSKTVITSQFIHGFILFLLYNIMNV